VVKKNKLLSPDLRPKPLPDDDGKRLNEVRVEGKEVYRGFFFNLMKDVVKASDNHICGREYIIHPGAAAVLPFLNDETILLERQWRYPVNQSLLEVPAGKIDPGESHGFAVRRELLEETGYRASHWCYLGKFYPVSSYSTELIHLYFAKGLEKKSIQNTESGECIELIEMRVNDYLDLVEKNIISDAKTLAFAFWVSRLIEKKFQPKWIRI
tara:strand:+ start:21705 stop:22337 length:633 start_codon:yes stop_codon:yes gene_type:complete